MNTTFRVVRKIITYCDGTVKGQYIVQKSIIEIPFFGLFKIRIWSTHCKQPGDYDQVVYFDCKEDAIEIAEYLRRLYDIKQGVVCEL
jgi:hypothetical protein